MYNFITLTDKTLEVRIFITQMIKETPQAHHQQENTEKSGPNFVHITVYLANLPIIIIIIRARVFTYHVLY